MPMRKSFVDRGGVFVQSFWNTVTILFLEYCHDTLTFLPYYNHHSYTKAKEDLANALLILNNNLENRTFLVGDSVTLADITIVSALFYPFKLVADPLYLEKFPNVTRWFAHCTSQAEFMAVVGKVTMCQTELVAMK